jgi:hypothetical protein
VERLDRENCVGNVVDKAWFADRLAMRKISQRKLAGMMDMDASAMSLMLSGKRKMSAQEAGEVAKLLGVSVEEVMRHAGIAVAVNVEKSVPVVGYVNDRMEVRMGRPKGPLTAAMPPECGKGCQALRIQTGAFFDGWLVFYQPNEGISLEAVGRLCIVRAVDEERGQLKFVSRGYEPGWHVLTSLRGGEPVHARLESAAPVAWLRQ